MTILLGNLEPPLERDPRRLSFRFLLSNFTNSAPSGPLSSPPRCSTALDCAAGANARHTVVGGRLIVDAGEIVTLDMAPVIREHDRKAARFVTLDG
jgi:hypothetical protein